VGHQLEQPPFGVAPADEVLPQHRQVALDDEARAGEHVAHHGGERVGQQVDKLLGVDVHPVGVPAGVGARSGDQGQEAAQVVGDAAAIKIDEVVHRGAQAALVLGSGQFDQVLVDAPLRLGHEGVGVEDGRLLPEREAAAAAGFPGQLQVEAPGAGRRDDGGEGPVQLDAVVGHGHRLQRGEGGQGPVGATGPHRVRLPGGRRAVEPVVGRAVGGAVGAAERPFGGGELAGAVFRRQLQQATAEAERLVP
jgi:hypothetical protein